MIKQKTENYRLEKWIDGSFTIWGRGTAGQPTPLMDMENQEELQEVCSLLRPLARERIPYKVWYDIAYHYAISHNATIKFNEQLEKVGTSTPNLEEYYWRRMWLTSMGKATAYRRMWLLLGGREGTLKDWYEEMKRRWQKGEHDYPNASTR